MAAVMQARTEGEREMKRTRVRIAAAAVLVALLAGCSGTGNPSVQRAGSGSPSSSPGTPVFDEPTTPTALPCPSNIPMEGHSDDCTGAVSIGWHASSEFSPRVGYRITGDGWIPIHDSLDHFVLIGPGGAFTGPGAEPHGSIEIHRSVFALNRRCAHDGQMVMPVARMRKGAAGIAAELSTRPGVIGTAPKPVEIGGLAGYMVDLRIDPNWTRHCFFTDVPSVPMIGGRSPSDVIHVLQSGFHYRDYFLDHGSAIIAIEINLVDGDDAARFSEVVETFRFS